MAGAAAGQAEDGGGRPGGRWRIAVWGIAGALWLLPWLGMQVLDGMNWDETDFIVWGVMLAVAAGICEVGAWMSNSWAYRAAVGVAAVAGFLLVWINLAVGFIGDEDNPANLMYAGVLAIGAIGAVIARCRPRGMVAVLVAMAVAHGLVGVVAQVAALDTRPVVLLANGFFVAVWLASASLFRVAASQPG